MTMKKNESNIGYQMLPIPACRASRLNDGLCMLLWAYGTMEIGIHESLQN